MSSPEDRPNVDARSATDGEIPVESEWASAPIAVDDNARSTLPGAGLAAWAVMARRLREDVIGDDLFSDPAWDILLDLYAALDRGDRVPATSVASMAGVPASTGRRWARKLVERGLLEREKDRRDHRLTYVRLTAKGRNIMTEYMVRLAAKGLPSLLH